jgi:exonuclease III
MTLHTHVPIITLNINDLEFSIRRHRITKWINKETPSLCCLQETHLSVKGGYNLKVQG